MRKTALTALTFASVVGIIGSASWVLLYVYIGAVSLVHGEISSFFEDISRENTPLFLLVAMVVLIVSAIIFVKSRRLLKSG